jgi:hypothetical protein
MSCFSTDMRTPRSRTQITLIGWSRPPSCFQLDRSPLNTRRNKFQRVARTGLSGCTANETRVW